MKPPVSTALDSPERQLPPGCAAARESLQNRLDGDESPESVSVREHRSQCADCRALEAASRLLLAALPNLCPASPSVEFADRVLAADRVEPYRPWFKRRWTWVGGLTLAASVLIAVFALTREDRTPLDTGRLVVIAPQPQPPATAKVPEEKPVPLRDSLQEASSAVASLTRKATADSFGLKLPKWTIAKGRMDPIANVEPPPASIQDMRHIASSGIAPITDSAKRAFDVFWREFGPGTDGKPVNN